MMELFLGEMDGLVFVKYARFDPLPSPAPVPARACAALVTFLRFTTTDGKYAHDRRERRAAIGMHGR